MNNLDLAVPEVAPDAATSRAERIRSRSADVMLALYRIVKTAMVHALDNAAVRDGAAQSAHVLASFSAEIAAPVSLSFLSDTFFVCGQLLRAPRATYEAAAELGELLLRIGVSELTFEPGFDGQRMLQLAAEITSALRQAGEGNIVFEISTPGVEARQIDLALLQRRTGDDLDPAAQILRLYATALVVLRQFYEDLAGGSTVMPQQLKRLAQRFVVLAERENPAMLGMTTMAKAHRDDAGRALQTAILSLAMARQVTKDRLLLSQLVLAALLMDIGRARVAGRIGDRLMSEKEEGFAVSATAFVCIASGGVNATNVRRTAIVTEGAWLERHALLGAPWNAQMPVFLASSILVAAREVLERVAPRAGGQAQPYHEAVAAVVTKHGAEPVLGRLLVRALGVVPVGTVVELSTGAWAVVMGPSRRGPHLSVVKIVIDPKGNEVLDADPIDLGEDRSMQIAKIVDGERVGFSTTGSFLKG